MPRTLAERAKDWRWWGEQVAHVVLGAVAALPAAWTPLPLVTAPCAALLLAGVREYEQRPVDSWGDLAVDVAATLLGGAIVGLAVWGTS